MTGECRKLSDIQLTNMIAEFGPMRCWKVGLYFGSMVYFHMQDKVGAPASDGSDACIGGATLSLDGDAWSILDCGVELNNSAVVTRDFAETTLDHRFSGQELLSFRLDKAEDRLSISFSGDLEILVSLNGPEENGTEDLMTFTLPNGQIACLNSLHGLVLSDEIIEETAALWRQQRVN